MYKSGIKSLRVVAGILSVITLFSSCQDRIDEQSFFVSPLKLVDDLPTKTLPTFVDTMDISPTRVFLWFAGDYMIVEEDKNEGIYSVSDVTRDSLIGLFCEKGRGDGEPLDGFLIHKENEGKDQKVWFHSVMSRTSFLWNVTQSIAQRKTVYDRVYPLKYDEEEYGTVLVQPFPLDDGTIVYRNLRQDGYKDWMIDAPRYDVFDLQSGERIRLIEPFKQGDSDKITAKHSKGLLNHDADIAPSKDIIAFGMNRFPIIGILDINSGETKFIRIKDFPNLDKEMSKLYFIAINCDESHIYLLSRDGVDTVAQPVSNPFASYLYVVDYDGTLRGKFKVEGSKYLSFDLDDGNLYYFELENYKRYTLPVSSLEPFLR